MSDFTDVYYYTLAELMGGVGNDGLVYMLGNLYSYETLQDEIVGSKGWLGMISLYINNNAQIITKPEALASAEVITLLRDFILPRCGYCNVVTSETKFDDVLNAPKEYDVPPTSFNDTPEEIRSFVARVGAWLAATYPKYKKLLDLYEAQETKLMDKLTTNTSGKTRFNDMPQSPIATGDIDGDDHLTNLTKDDNESATDPETPMMRLAEIQANYKNIYNDWCDEFAKTFIIM